MHHRFIFVLRLCLVATLLTGTFFQTPTVYAASLPAEINKQFTPLQIDAGGVSVLRVTIFNPNSFELTNASWTDNLVSVQPGLYIANPAGVVNTCNGTVNAVPGATSFSLSGGTVPPQVGANPGECYVEVNISSVTPGSLINTIPANNLVSQGDDSGTIVSITNTTPASATITVIAISPPSLSKSFAPNTIFVGQSSVLTIRLNNNDSDTNLTGTSYTDTLPVGLVIATPSGLTATNCGSGAVTAPAGGTTISLSDGTVTPSQDCVVTVNVTGASGSYTIATGTANTIPAGPGGLGSLQTVQGVTNNTPAQAELTIQPIGVTKSFAPDPIVAGGTSVLTITLQNPTAAPYTGVHIADTIDNTLPGLEIVAGTENTSCVTVGPPTHTLSVNTGTQTIDLTNGTVPALGTCTITVTVRAPLTISNVQTIRTNTIPVGALTQVPLGITNVLAAQDTLTVNPALAGSKTYAPANIPINGLSLVTITVTNNSAIAFTDIDFSDTLPTNLSVATTSTVPAASANPTTTCTDGVAPDPTVTNTATAVTLTNGELAANSNCTVTFYATGSVAGSGTTYENTLPVGAITACTAASGCVGNGSIIRTGTDLTIFSSPLPVGLSKAFQTNPIQPGQTSRLRITITAPADTSVSGINLTDTLPAGLVIANPPAPAETCPGGTLTAVNGTDIITFSNLAANVLAAGVSCTIDVWITSSTPNSYTVANGNANVIPANSITTIEGRTNTAAATAELIVTTMTMSKAFYPNYVQNGGLSTLTITLRNSSTSPLTIVTLTDTLPGSATTGVRVAPIPNATTTCTGGVISAIPGSGTVSMTGGTVPAQVGGVQGLCTIVVDVEGRDSTPASPSTQTNTIPITNVLATVQSTGNSIRPQAQAQATLTIQPLTMGVVKGFNPVLVYGGAYSTMSVQLVNPNSTAVLTGISFTDDMTLLGTGMQLANPVTFNVGTCGGVLTGNPGDTSFLFSGGVLPANSSCTLTLRVVMAVNGNRTNRIPAGAVTTFNGVSNPDPTEASLTNLPGVSVNKTFNPAQVLTNQPSTLTITIRNTSNVPVVNMGVADNLPGTLPDGLEVANPANATNTCGGTLTAIPGAQTIQLTGGGLAALGSGGDICVVSVDVLSTRPGVYLNTIPSGAITADGGVTNNDPASADLTVDPGLFSLGNRVWFDTDNSQAINGAEMGVDGVSVQLYASDAGGNPTGAALGTDTTSNGGYYRFDDLSAGDYVVVIPVSQFDAGGPLAGYWSSGTTMDGSGVLVENIAPDPDNNMDGDDNGTRQASGAFANAVVSRTVTLGPSANEPATDNDPGTNPEAGEAVNAQSNRTVDFGFYSLQLGNLVYVDANGTGTYDAGDATLAGATVELFAADDATEINVGPDGLLGSADDGSGGVTTGAGGTYQFLGLPAGDYIVRATPPAGFVSTIDTADPADTTGPNANSDNNDNGVGTSGGAVSSNIVTLTPGNAGAQTNNTVTNATGTTFDPTLDFGFIAPLFSLGNRVWFDTDNNGTMDGSELGVNGVRVELYLDDGATPGTFDAGDTFLTFDTTDTSGYYRFDSLNAGDYVVLIPNNQFATGGVLNGYWSSATNISNAGAVSDNTANDPDTDTDDSDDNGVTSFGGGNVDYVSSAAITLGPSANEPINDIDPVTNPEAGESPDAQSNRTVDFGFYRLQLGNLAFVDANNNGTYDAGDTLSAGATVQLYAADGTTEINVGPDGALGTADDATGGVITNAGGSYLFSGLPAGDYIVRTTPPTGYFSTTDTADVADTNDPDVNTDNNDNGIGSSAGTVSSNVVTLTPGSMGALNNNTVTNSTGTTVNPTVDFGFIQSAALGDTVFLDDGAGGGIAGNGVQDGSEAGISGITIYVDIDSSGTFNAGDLSDTTDGNGNYAITNILPGSYTVAVSNPPAGYALTTGNDPTNTALSASETDNTIDFGYIGPRADLSLDKSVSDSTPFVATDITFTLDVTNSGPDAAPNVEVTDVLPSGFTYVSDDSGGAYDSNTGIWTVGDLAVNQTLSLNITVTVNVTGSYTNYAEVTSSDLVDPDSTPDDDSNNQDDDASVTITPAQNDPDGLTKTLSGSNQAFTLNSNAAIGEIVEYTVSVTVPSGTFNNAQLVDTMQRGLSFMDCISITDNGLTTSAVGGFTSICSTPTVDDAGGGTPTDVGRRVTFDFDTLTNNTGSDQQLIVVYRAVVLDSSGNVSGTALHNSAAWTSDAGSITPESETVTVVEPELSILKTANASRVAIGSVVTFTLTVRHTTDSETNAYDVLVTDTLPSALQYVVGSLDCTTGAQDADVTCSESGGTITAEWSNFAFGGGDGRVTFQASVISLPTRGISNTANVAWTSLPGNVSTPQNTNLFSTERDYDPPSQVDIYGVSSTLILNNPNTGGSSTSNGSSGGQGGLLPDTGFAPNVVTDLSHIPQETYTATGDVTVEIPSLGVNIPVVGVPKKNGTWNVSWLGNQAGWLEGSAFPSWSGNSVLTGHVYSSNGLPGPFVNLGKLKFGDRIIIHAYGQKYTFEVQENKIVEPNDSSAMKHEEKSWLTLVTCKEYDAKTNTYRKRIVVRAVLVSVAWE